MIGVVDELELLLGFAIHRDLEGVVSQFESLDTAYQRAAGFAGSERPHHISAIESCVGSAGTGHIPFYFNEDVAAADHIGPCGDRGDFPFLRCFCRSYGRR